MLTIKKSSLNEKQTEALYIINKAAKELRDTANNVTELRNKIKGRIYGNDSKSTPEFTDEEQKLLKDKYDIGPINFKGDPYDDCFDTIPELVESIKKCMYWPKSNLRISDCYDFVAFGDYFNQSGAVDWEWDDEEEIDKYIEEILDNLLQSEDLEDKLHKFLSDAKSEIDDIKNRERLIYKLKSAVLISNLAEPVAYHIMAHGDDLLAYYKINGFGFHRKVDRESLSDDELDKIDETAVIDMIDAANTAGIIMSSEEAITILLQYLGVEGVTPEEYLAGECDLSQKLGIEIYETPRRSYYDDSFDPEDDEDYFDDDEYFDGDDEFYDDDDEEYYDDDCYDYYETI